MADMDDLSICSSCGVIFMETREITAVLLTA